MTPIVIILIVFGVSLLIGLPMGIAIGLAALAPHLFIPSFPGDASFIIRGFISGVDTTPLLAVPMFMLSGAIMAKGGISEKLFNFFAYFTGKRRAGMPITVIVTCLFFGAISGSGPATTAAVGSMTIPVLVGLGYDKIFATAVVAVAGGLGVIIPPSIPFVLFGLAADTSIGDLFIAGIFPGILIAVSLMVYAYIYCLKNGEDKVKINQKIDSLKKAGLKKLFIDSFFALLTPVIILGGIYGGLTTPTEAAVISVMYAIIVCLFVYKTVTIRELPKFLFEAVRSYSPLLLLFMSASAFGRVLAITGTPVQLAYGILNTFGGNNILFMVVFTLVLLLLGMFMDVGPAILILGPILKPLTGAMGIHPVYLGVIMVVSLAIGFVTPPFGVNLFVAAPMAETKVIILAKKAAPFVVAFVFALFLLVFFPQISLALIGGK